MLPCNVIVQEKDGGLVEIAIVDPIASMKAIENDELHEIAAEISARLRRVIDKL